ncbi:MAG: hypothetical protein GX116_08090 [Fibrobacter sp.]|nr:hypothetical protein [Fibrobacter sp.]
MIIPEKGFCKVVISMTNEGYQYSKNDNLLMNHFFKENIKMNPNDVPYCEVE